MATDLPALPAPTPSRTRKILALPRINDVYYLLMDRVDYLLWQFYLEEERFFVFINAIPRNHTVGTWKEIKSFAGVELINAGIFRLREIWEGRDKEKRVKDLDHAWNILVDKTITVEETIVGSEIFEEFDHADFDFNDIAKSYGKTLVDYFKSLKSKTEKVTVWTEAEYDILKHHLGEENFPHYRYISLPLIQFQELDGVVHIVYLETDEKEFYDKSGIRKNRVGKLIQGITNEYEGVILDSDIEYRYRERTLEEAFNEISVTSRNPLIRALRFKDYYTRYAPYYRKRFELSREIPKLISRSFHEIAILQILIDSYAHNISAHSLSALQWLFRQRAFATNRKANDLEYLPGDFADDLLFRPTTSFDREIHFLLRFLWEKGAYWSGLIRDYQFGGKISSLYSVLWYDFVNNPFYLGTIAFSEGIMRININVTVLETVGDEDEVYFKKRVKADGVFATIDLTKFSKKFNPARDEKGLTSQFVSEGKDFTELAVELKKIRAFFPGGVVGKHAFFTILENEIRNVKHYTGSLAEMRKNGLTLNITVEEDSYWPREKGANGTSSAKNQQKFEYFKIGVFIRQTIKVDTEVEESLSKLREDIIEPETYRARLGGIYQDKVCAAMLLNNTSGSVQEEFGSRYKRFYPWVKLGIMPKQQLKAGGEIEELEISVRKYYSREVKDWAHLRPARETFDRRFPAMKKKQVYFKKIFHLWKGEDLYPVAPNFDIDIDVENISRFRFLTMSADEEELFFKIRSRGVFRILRQKDTVTPIAPYDEWLKIWKGTKPELINLVTVNANLTEQAAGQIIWDGKKVEHLNEDNLADDNKFKGKVWDIKLRHGGSGKKIGIGAKEYRYRTNGILINHFFEGKERFWKATMKAEYASELLEVFSTRICIFDNRLAERFAKFDPHKLNDLMLCTVYGESEENWRKEQKAGFMRHNFLVVHLSFIEALMKQKGHRDLGELILKDIVGEKLVPDNFIIIITSGRGRADWREDLLKFDEIYPPAKPGQKPCTTFTTFRPIETLVAAVENAITMGDDVELKYRLVKTFFGS